MADKLVIAKGVKSVEYGPFDDETAGANGKLQKDQDHLHNLTRIQRWRVNLWARVNVWAEAQWLTANGWKEMEPSGWWSLPHWHPRRSQPQPKEVRGETRIVDGALLYSQSHAANSQRFYFRRVQTQAPRPRLEMMPTYLRLQSWSLLLVTCTNLCGISSVVLYEYWYSRLFCVAAIIFGCATAYVVYVTRKGCELDYAEQKLGGKDGVHYPNQAGGRR